MRISALAALILVSGCTDYFLDREERRALSSEARAFGPTLSPPPEEDEPDYSLRYAATLANRLSGAYYRSAKNSSKAQDLASGIVVLSAVSVVTGAAQSASDTALADRAIVGATAERIGSRGVSKASIKAVLKGAKTMNCIGSIATVYSATDSSVKGDRLAVELTFAAIREVRISVRDDLTRDVESFSSVVNVLQEVLPKGGTGREAGARIVGPQSAAQADLETYLKRLAGCLKKPEISENTNK